MSKIVKYVNPKTGVMHTSREGGAFTLCEKSVKGFYRDKQGIPCIYCSKKFNQLYK